METQNSQQNNTTGLEIKQQNIHIIASCIKEIHECLADIEKVSQSFLGKTVNQVPSLEKYVPNFLKIIRTIRAVIENSLALGSQVVVYFKQGKIDLELSQSQFQEAIDRLFELNILTGQLETFDKELKQYLESSLQFQHKAETRKGYVKSIVDQGEIALLRDLYTLNVRRGLYGIRSGWLDGDIALKEDSIYNSQRVSNQTIQYFRKITQQLKIETRPILTEVRQIIAKKQPETTRDNSHHFIISILETYNHSLTELVKEKLTEPILRNFIISPDNLRVVGLGMEGDLFYKIHLANELFSLGRLAPLEKVKKRNLIKAEIVSPEMESTVRLICDNLFDPIDFDLIYNIIADVKVHTREIPSMLHAIGKASLNVDEALKVPMNTRHYTIHKIPKGDEKTDHQMNETLFTNTNIYRIKTFLIVFSYFYYRVAASDGDNF